MLRFQALEPQDKVAKTEKQKLSNDRLNWKFLNFPCILSPKRYSMSRCYPVGVGSDNLAEVLTTETKIPSHRFKLPAR
eukprot:4447731-Amphidinium_carterae.1